MVPGISSPLSENDCTKFFETLLQVDLSWNWDSRFRTTLAHIRTEEQNTIREILENHLRTAWDSVTIATAPESVQLILISLGGIMSGQLFYATGIPEDGILFCAWWPWRNGQTFSIRIGTSPEGSPLLDMLVSPEAR